MNWWDIWPVRRVRVEHVRYVKKPDRDDIRAKARQMYIERGLPVPEALRRG